MARWTNRAGGIAPVLAGILAASCPAQGLQDFFSGLIGGRPEAPARPLPPRETPFRMGFNQGWLPGGYGRQWTEGWDEAVARRLLASTRRFGGDVLRIWLFEGFDPGAIEWDGDPARTAWGHPARRRRATGVAPAMLRNLGRFLELCDEEGVQAYLTLFDGNGSMVGYPAAEARREERLDLLGERGALGPSFREAVLGPVLEVVRAHPGTVYGIDLINEGNALVRQGYFPEGWADAAAFVRRWRAFVRERVDVPVTMSFGHHDAIHELLAGHLPEDAVDFLDLHLYDDHGRIPRGRELAALAARVPVVLGEYGQLAKRFDDALQVRVMKAFLSEAHRLGLAGAFAWRLEDVRPGFNPEARFSFYAHDAWRPAALTHARIAGQRLP